MDLFVTNLGQDQIVLGYPFLQLFNPTINWKEGDIRHSSEVLATPVQLWRHCKKVWQLDKVQCLRKTMFAQQWSAEANKDKVKLKE
jgi:hypothetical protein